MNKILLSSLAYLILSISVFAQSPQKINYQGIARDVKGNPLSNQKINLKLQIVPNIESSLVEYAETQSTETNNFGLYTLQIGNGVVESGNFSNIKWETGTKFIKVFIDAKGGNNYEEIGTTQLLSVPYALYANKAGTAKELAETTTKTRTGTVSSSAAHVAGDANYIPKFTALNTIGKSLMYDNGSNIGIGTTTPAATLNVKSTASTELIRMQSTSTTGSGKFTMYNDLNYATFTKYGSAATGGYTGIASQFPYASLLAFGNNGGGFLISNGGSVGISLLKGSSNLKLYADYTTLNLGLGGNAIPATNVHINGILTGDTVKITNATTGHLATDGFDIRTVGNNVSLMNRENATLDFGTNNTNAMTISPLQNVGIGIPSPTTKLHVVGAELTTGLFESAGVDNTSGILKSEYTGTTLDDHIAIYGKSQPSLSENYGIGIYGEGGFIGIRSFAKNTGIGSVYGGVNEASSRGETFGVYGNAQLDITGNLGTKIGVMGYAKGGLVNIGVYGSADTTGAFADTYAGYFDGNLGVTGDLFVAGNIAKGGGTFKIDHPLDPENKYLYHSFVESPDMMNVYNGNVVTDANGKATVKLPDYFDALNKDFRYQLTAIGGPAQVWIDEEVSNNQFKIKSSVPNAKVSWQVTGVRKDNYANAHRVVAEVEKRAEDKGKYLYPLEAGKKIENGIQYKKSINPNIRK